MNSEDTQTKIRDLQLFEQNLQNISAQKQQFQSQLFEIDSAMSELKNTSESYKIIGNVMVKVNSLDLQKELDEKKEMISLRLKSLDKQEKTLSEKAVELQKEVMKKLDTKKSS